MFGIELVVVCDELFDLCFDDWMVILFDFDVDFVGEGWCDLVECVCVFGEGGE